MSGLGEIGGFYGLNVNAGPRVQQKDIDQYIEYIVTNPSVDGAFIATITAAVATAFVFKNFVPDYPRNVQYAVTGTTGGTYDLSGYDQFGSTVKEHVVIGSASGGGTTQGTQMFGSFVAGTFTSNGGTQPGTATIGFGTAAGATGNWFGLPLKIAGTGDVRGITWINNTTPTGLNKGTGLGTLVSSQGTTPWHAFQGTSGVAATDKYIVEIKTQFDNTFKGEMTNL